MNRPQSAYFGPLGTGYGCVPATIEDAIRYPTPVGEACLNCTLAIAEGDRGWMRAVSHGPGHNAIEPVHVECELLGVVGHQFGICTCTGYATHGPDSRAAAIELFDLIQSMPA